MTRSIPREKSVLEGSRRSTSGCAHGTSSASLKHEPFLRDTTGNISRWSGIYPIHNYMHTCVGVLSMVYACTCCCRSRGIVEAYRDLLELVREACFVARCGGMWIVPVYLAMKKLPAYQSTSYRYAIVWSLAFGDKWHQTYSVTCKLWGGIHGEWLGWSHEAAKPIVDCVRNCITLHVMLPPTNYIPIVTRYIPLTVAKSGLFVNYVSICCADCVSQTGQSKPIRFTFLYCQVAIHPV